MSLWSRLVSGELVELCTLSLRQKNLGFVHLAGCSEQLRVDSDASRDIPRRVVCRVRAAPAAAAKPGRDVAAPATPSLSRTGHWAGWGGTPKITQFFSVYVEAKQVLKGVCLSSYSSLCISYLPVLALCGSCGMQQSKRNKQ